MSPPLSPLLFAAACEIGECSTLHIQKKISNYDESWL